jgi:AraC family transcriptional regulator
MEPRLVETGRMTLLGVGFFGDPFRLSGGWTEENEIGRTWNRLMAYLGEHGERIQHVTSWEVMYEVHVEHPETAQTGEFEVFCGVEVERLEDVPVELTCKVLPPTTYAVFTLRGEQITSDWNRYVAEWMSRSGYQRAHPYGFQRYDERFKGLDQIEGSVLEVYVPVRRELGN